MNKPDPADGSLESILASIRKSLAEQSTEALSDAAADQDKDARPSRKSGLTQRLAGATVTPAPPQIAKRSGDDLSDLLEEPASAHAARSAPATPAAEDPRTVPKPAPSGESDPLWFLTRREDAVQDTDLPPLGAPGPNAPAESGTSKAAADPGGLTRPEVLRASMPPFFGSTAEAANSALPPMDTAKSASTVQPQAAIPSAFAPPSGAQEAMAREASLLAAAAEMAASRPSKPEPQPVPPATLNGKGPVVPDAAPATETPHIRALEITVLDLLKPMLRQWLDENMPRLVAEALGEEVQRSRTGAGEPKKT
jgi:cell pole-organizing protein PopZ